MAKHKGFHYTDGVCPGCDTYKKTFRVPITFTAKYTEEIKAANAAEAKVFAKEKATRHFWRFAANAEELITTGKPKTVNQ